MNSKAPKILNDIVQALSKSNLKAVTEDVEGRVNSKKDENKIIAWLSKQPQFEGRIKDSPTLRGFADMEVIDDDGVAHMVNIKTSLGYNDNAFSKLGLLWSLTDMTIDDFKSLKINNKVGDKQFADLVLERKKDTNRDYWYLSVDKNDFSKVMVRGVKQIVNWLMNPTNNLQIVWKKEHNCDPGSKPFDEVFEDIITNGVFYCWEQKANHWKSALEHRKKSIQNQKIQ